MFSTPRDAEENAARQMAVPDFFRIFAKGNGKPN
jgi:hypothetical protein